MDRKRMKRLADNLLRLHDDREALARNPKIVHVFGLTAWIDCHGIVMLHGIYYTSDQLCNAIESATKLGRPVICRGSYYYASGVKTPWGTICPEHN